MRFMKTLNPYHETLQDSVSPNVSIEKNTLLPFSIQIGWQLIPLGALQWVLLFTIRLAWSPQPTKICLIIIRYKLTLVYITPNTKWENNIMSVLSYFRFSVPEYSCSLAAYDWWQHIYMFLCSDPKSFQGSKYCIERHLYKFFFYNHSLQSN